MKNIILYILSSTVLVFLLQSCNENSGYLHYRQQQYYITTTASGLIVNDTCDCHIRTALEVPSELTGTIYENRMWCQYYKKDSTGKKIKIILTDSDLYKN